MAPPKFTIPPAPAKAPKGQRQAYVNYINAHPSMKPFAATIYNDANQYGIDPVYFASLLWKESFAAAKASGQNPATIRSPAGAIGLGQIMPLHIGEAVPWAPGKKITQADLENPAFNLRWSAYYFSQQVSKYGSYEAAYKKGYNPGYTGPVFQDVPKSYVPTTTSQSPTQVAARAAEVAGAKQQINDPWVVVGKRGVLKYVNSASPPPDAVTYAGQPVTRSQFLQLWDSRFNPIYQAYLGRNATPAEVKQMLRGGISDYALTNALTKRPGFVGSPIWKRDAPGYVAVAQQIFGNNWNPADPDNRNAIRYAIANNLGADGFAQRLRSGANYTKSNEFQQNANGLQNVYATIFGTPDDNGRLVIQQAALQGWNADQFASYLRSQDSYKRSPEYETKMLSFLSQLGIITGRQPTLHAAPNAGGQSYQGPVDPRVGTPQTAPKPQDALAIGAPT